MTDAKIRNLIKICNLILSHYHRLLADEHTKINTVRKIIYHLEYNFFKNTCFANQSEIISKLYPIIS